MHSCQAPGQHAIGSTVFFKPPALILTRHHDTSPAARHNLGVEVYSIQRRLKVRTESTILVYFSKVRNLSARDRQSNELRIQPMDIPSTKPTSRWIRGQEAINTSMIYINQKK